MTDRRAPTSFEVLATTLAALDQADAELRNLRAHLASAGPGFAASRSAAIVSGITATIAHQVRDHAARESAALDRESA